MLISFTRRLLALSCFRRNQSGLAAYTNLSKSPHLPRIIYVPNLIRWFTYISVNKDAPWRKHSAVARSRSKTP